MRTPAARPASITANAVSRSSPRPNSSGSEPMPPKFPQPRNSTGTSGPDSPNVSYRTTQFIATEDSDKTDRKGAVDATPDIADHVRRSVESVAGWAPRSPHSRHLLASSGSYALAGQISR